jgi:beta-glucosidase
VRLSRSKPDPKVPAIRNAKSNTTFPQKFVWGAATAAPQIEGAAFTDGKGESIWDRFSRHTGEGAERRHARHGVRPLQPVREDFALMRSLGIRNYRLSIAWPSIYPKGDGALNQAGLDFYHRLFDSMAKNGITPWVTLFHWDLPQALEDRGGWTSRVTVDAFATYADTVVKAFAGKVKRWITLNEIRCFTILGYGPKGLQGAPAASSPAQLVNQTFHHALLCHGHGVRAVRAHGGKGARSASRTTATPALPSPRPRPTSPPRTPGSSRRTCTSWTHLPGQLLEGLPEAGRRDAPVVAKGDFKLIIGPDGLPRAQHLHRLLRAAQGGEVRGAGAAQELPARRQQVAQPHAAGDLLGPAFAHEATGRRPSTSPRTAAATTWSPW